MDGPSDPAAHLDTLDWEFRRLIVVELANVVRGGTSRYLAEKLDRGPGVAALTASERYRPLLALERRIVAVAEANGVARVASCVDWVADYATAMRSRGARDPSAAPDLAAALLRRIEESAEPARVTPASRIPAAPSAGRIPAAPSAGRIPAAPSAGRLPAAPSAGRIPAAPSAGRIGAAPKQPDRSSGRYSIVAPSPDGPGDEPR